MAKRPVFVVGLTGNQLVSTHTVEFSWHAGFAVTQKRMSIRSLHENAIKQIGSVKILEISTKSEEELGVALSAFNLSLGGHFVESLFQGSKVFEQGGPFREIYSMSGRDAKRDPRIRNSGKLIRFEFQERKWELNPKTAFYDWLYLNALNARPDLAAEVAHYNAFTDIEFNPETSINCQAGAAALYTSLKERGVLASALSTPENYLKLMNKHVNAAKPSQGKLDIG